MSGIILDLATIVDLDLDPSGGMDPGGGMIGGMTLGIMTTTEDPGRIMTIMAETGGSGTVHSMG